MNEIDKIMNQVLAHIWWMSKDDEIYNAVKKSITENPDKKEELVKLLSN